MVCTTTDSLYCSSRVSVVLLVASEADPSKVVVFHEGVSQRGTYCITYCDVSAYVSISIKVHIYTYVRMYAFWGHH